jgi:hypothetical protein
MTLIGCVRGTGERFVCFGDAVMSGTDPHESSQFWSPIGGDLQVAPGELGPKALVQKLVRLADNAILGWSGTGADVIRLTRSLLANVHDDHLPSAKARACLQAFTPADRLDGFVAVNESGQVLVHEIGSLTPLDVPGLGACLLAGSGTADFVPTLLEAARSFRFEGAAPPPIEDVAVVVLAAMLANDLSHDTAVDAGYGGAFEVAVSSGHRLRKVDQLAVVLWASTPSSGLGRRIRGPLRALGQLYIDRETLACWSLERLDPTREFQPMRARTVLPPHLYAASRRWALEEELSELPPADPHSQTGEAPREVGRLEVEPRYLVHLVLSDEGHIHIRTRANGDGFLISRDRFAIDEQFPFWLKGQVEAELARSTPGP